MNLETLHAAQATFLNMYPEGFADPGIQPIRKKHNVDKLVSFTRENLTQLACNKPDFVATTMTDVISRSSMVSRFEKPPFRKFIDALSSSDKRKLARAVEDRLYGDKQRGFEEMVELMTPHKIAKWPVITAVPFYFAPKREAFVKPTTAKRIINALEVDDLHYNARPSWDFYRGFRKLLNDVKKEVDPSLAPSTAALSGFLMMTL